MITKSPRLNSDELFCSFVVISTILLCTKLSFKSSLNAMSEAWTENKKIISEYLMMLFLTTFESRTIVFCRIFISSSRFSLSHFISIICHKSKFFGDF